MDEKSEQRACVKFCFKTGKTASETYELLKTAFGDKCLSRSNVFIWFNRFKNGRESVEDEPRSGRPSTSKTDDNVVKVRDLVRSDRRLTIREMSDELNLSFYAVQSILTEDLNMRRVSAKFIPKLLTDEQKQHRFEVQFLAKFKIPVLPQPPYSPDIAPADFYLFPKLKFSLKGHRFDTIEDIQANTERVLNTLKKENFQECFQKWKHRWSRCVQSQGNYF